MIARMPLVVLRVALSFLAVEDLLANATVCRRWMRWISHPEALPREPVSCSRRIKEWLYEQGVRWRTLRCLSHLGCGPQQAAFVDRAALCLDEITQKPDPHLRPRKLMLHTSADYFFRADWFVPLLSAVEELHISGMVPPVFNPLPLCGRLKSLRIFVVTDSPWLPWIREARNQEFCIDMRMDVWSQKEAVSTLTHWLPLAARIRDLSLVINDTAPRSIYGPSTSAPHALVRMIRRFRLCDFSYAGHLPFIPLDAVPHLTCMHWGVMHMTTRRKVERFLALLPEVHCYANDKE